jgi:hypothetical protein
MMPMVLPVLPCQTGDLQQAGADHILLFGRQGALFDLGYAFHVVHGPDDADRYLDVPIREGAQVFDGIPQEIAHFIIQAGAAEESGQGRGESGGAYSGGRTIHQGLRNLVDRNDRRDLSIFQIGFRYIQRRLTNAFSVSVPL